MIVHLIDGTYELFRHYYAVPKAQDKSGIEVAAVRGVLGSIRGMLNSRVATHVGVATDHVIESFRNDMWPGYKTGEGIEPESAVAVSPARRSAVAHSASSCGRWSSTRPTMRWRRRR